MTQLELRSAIEAILFVSGEPVRSSELAEVLGEETTVDVERQLEAISRSLAEAGAGIVLENIAGAYRFSTRPELDPYVRRFFSKKGEGRLSIASLETLSIIAYRQPVTLPEISEIRGVNSSGVLRTLLERKMIRIAGRKNVVGSPFLYRTTRDFLMHFGLGSIQDLPRLDEFSEILGESVPDDALLDLAEGAGSRTAAEGEGSYVVSESESFIDRSEMTPPVQPPSEEPSVTETEDQRE